MENNSAAVVVVVVDSDVDAHNALLPFLETDWILLVLRGTRREEAEYEYEYGCLLVLVLVLHNKDGKKAVVVLDLVDTEKSIMSLIVKEFML